MKELYWNYTSKNLFKDKNFALNEVAVSKKDTSSMIRIDAYIDDEFLNTYWADGLVISTPTGSTGYSFELWRANYYAKDTTI